MIILPYIISSAIGYLIIDLLSRKSEQFYFSLKMILGIGLGLGLSSQLTFYSFLFFNRLEPQFIILLHLVIFIGLIVLKTGEKLKIFFKSSGGAKKIFFSNTNDRQVQEETEAARPKPRILKEIFLMNFAAYVIIFLLTVFIIYAVIIQARLYPYGGWDAWQVWNFKAKFLFLAGDNWKDLFSPELWRTSPHYPLLLPLINVWAWIFTTKPVDIVPMITSTGFTFLTTGLLCAALWQRTKNIFSLLPGFLLLSLPFFNSTGTTQYCDIVLSFYLLAAVVTLSEDKKQSAFLSGVFTGFLGFTKPEGLVAAMILCALLLMLTAWDWIKKDKTFFLPKAGYFFFGLGIALMPTFAFEVLYSPGNQTFVNGLTSTLKPSSWERFVVILGFLGIELKSGKWNGLWFLMLLGLFLGGKTLWARNNKITAWFLILYLTVIIAYYQLNTYFEITWWLSVSLNRILFSLLPLFLFWIFGGILERVNQKPINSPTGTN